MISLQKNIGKTTVQDIGISNDFLTRITIAQEIITVIDI
jgi:hypothetical protein